MKRFSGRWPWWPSGSGPHRGQWVDRPVAEQKASGRAGRPFRREARPPHHVGAEYFSGGLKEGPVALVRVGPCSCWSPEPWRGAWGPQRDRPASASHEAEARVPLSLWVGVLTAGARGNSCTGRAPTLSPRPLVLGPEQVAGMVGVSSGSGLGWGGRGSGVF